MKDIIKRIKEKLDVSELEKIQDDEYRIVVKLENIYESLVLLKREGFEHLSLISATDWIKDNKFELVYILYSYKDKTILLVSIFIDRRIAKGKTIKELWPVAATYEREIYEMFGIEFEGNDDKRPFILEGWKGMPPMRKDFDLNKYANKKFNRRKYA